MGMTEKKPPSPRNTIWSTCESICFLNFRVYSLAHSELPVTINVILILRLFELVAQWIKEATSSLYSHTTILSFGY